MTMACKLRQYKHIAVIAERNRTKSNERTNDRTTEGGHVSTQVDWSGLGNRLSIMVRLGK